MRSNASPYFFQTHNNSNTILSKKFAEQQFDLTVILDPNIFFIMNQGMYSIHPIIKSWLGSVQTNNNIKQLKIYLLSNIPGPPIIKLGGGSEPYQFRIGADFFSLLDQKSLDYIKKLWNEQIQIATLSDDTTTGISDFTDDFHTDGNDIIVISADPVICDFFHKRKVVVKCMNPPNLPIMPHDIANLDNNSGLVAYCDFDGTLFNSNDYMLYRMLTSASDETVDSMMPPSFLQFDTINLLKQLQQNGFPIHLLTQRTYKIDQKQPLTNNGSNIVNRINQTYNLSIKANEESYLNSHEQIEKHRQNHPNDEESTGYLSKIEALYQRIKNLPENLRPKHVMLIDDDLREILKFYYAKKHYANLGIELHPTLIMKLIYYCDDALNLLENYDTKLHKQIKYQYSQELAKLESGVEMVKYNQGMKQIDDLMNHIHQRTNLQIDANDDDLSIGARDTEYKQPLCGCAMF